MDHPKIQDVGVVGIPHERLGEAPVAFIIKSDESVTENDVHSYMREKFAKHKQLTGGIHFVDELPKNQTGKLMRKVLKQMFLEENS